MINKNYTVGFAPIQIYLRSQNHCIFSQNKHELYCFLLNFSQICILYRTILSSINIRPHCLRKKSTLVSKRTTRSHNYHPTLISHSYLGSNTLKYWVPISTNVSMYYLTAKNIETVRVIMYTTNPI
jgi:hypothetical protein